MNLFTLWGTILIDAEAAGEVISQTMEKAKKLGESLDGAGKSADGTSTKLNTGSKFNTACVWMGNALTELTKKATSLAFSLAKMGFEFDIGMESYQYQFEALIGDADKASQLVADLQELAKISPLGMEGLANNAVNLLTTGTELADVLPTLEMLGNLSLGNTDRMQSVVRAYTQILGKGGLMAQEMYQLGDAMVPIIEIMTKYGGERYADGSWYQEKMSNPKYQIPAEDMVKAFAAATAEGGKWHDYMLTIMDSFAGMYDRFGEEGKETLGSLFQPFFDVAKSDVLPKLIESLGEFRTWIDENKESIAAIAQSLGTLATEGFDNALNFFKWATENQGTVTAAFTAIAAAVGALVATTHPWLAAISAVLVGLTEIANAQNEIDKGMETLGIKEDYYENPIKFTFETASETDKSIFEMIKDINKEQPTVKVGAGLEEGAESALQSELDGQSLSVDVKVNPIWAAFLNFNKRLGIIADGSHASGLDRVPFDGYTAILHKDEAVLKASEANVWRNGGGQTADNGRLEALVGNMISLMQQIVTNTASGQNIVLDSGVLVGQLAPQFDTKLGTISSRKGRRN